MLQCGLLTHLVTLGSLWLLFTDSVRCFVFARESKSLQLSVQKYREEKLILVVCKSTVESSRRILSDKRPHNMRGERSLYK